MEITGENNVKAGKYCGELNGTEVVVGGDHAVIKFHSDDSVQKRGFLLFFSAGQPSKYKSTALVEKHDYYQHQQV